MFKKIMSLVLALIVIMSVAMVAVSAAEANADTAADAGAETAAGNKLYFEPDTAGWKNFKKMYCHIWSVETGESFFPWQAKGSACVNKDGKWYYDLDAKKVKLNSGELYCLIFSNENGMQTYDLLFDATVIGDSAYCDGTTYENPADSSKTCTAAFWRGQNKTKFGPAMCVTSIGNLVGTCMPRTTTNVAMFEKFLTDNLVNAQTFSGKDDQAIIDDIAKALGLGKKNVVDAIAKTGVTVKWDKAKSPLKDEEVKPSNPTGGAGTQTGQDSTLVFVMLGLMIAAAGAVMFVRKRETA